MTFRSSRSHRYAVAFAAGLAYICLATSSQASPVVPGYQRLAAADDAESSALAGEILLGELNCLSCHAADEPTASRISTKSAPDLSEVGARVSTQYMREFLRGSHAAKPGTTMPDLFHASAPDQRDATVESLVHFLASKGGPNKPPRFGGSARLVEQGRELFHSVGCVACHAPETGAETLTTQVVPLGNLAKKTTVDALAEFLLDPAKVRKSGRMPNLWLGEHEARAIAVYLLRDQLKGPGGAAVAAKKESGVEWQYFEAPMGDKLPDFDKLTAKETGEHDRITFNMSLKKARENFAMRWRSTLHVPRDGEWTFFTVSDDGSSLLIDGEVVVDNDGIHTSRELSGKATLKAGDHDLEVRYFQKVSRAVFGVGWQGPEVRKQRIPPGNLFLPKGDPMLPVDHEDFVVDRQKAAAGAVAFTSMRCASCHQLDGAAPPPAATVFADLNPDKAGGCLSKAIAQGVPDFELSEAQREAIKAALANRAALPTPLDPEQQVHRTFAAMNCYACHQRGSIGGPDDARREFFKTKLAIDLGEEGKIPPNLNTAGAKLRPEALAKILYDGELHVRGRYMATRMPGFGKANLEPLAAALIKADSTPADAVAPEFVYGSARDGQAMVGTSGVACITCHNIAGRAGIGVPGIDLAATQQRLNPGWFNRFMRDPAGFNKDTRMPNYWPGGVATLTKLADGDTARQIDGIWNYLSLGKSMPPPPGLPDEGGAAGTELKPMLEPIVHRTFMTDVGPRAICAGFPERVNIAFDANVVRLAKAWRGRFFDASGVASGRSDKFYGPLGTDVINLPPGPSFAFLPSGTSPWPTAAKTDRDIGGQFGGYRLTPRGEPVFLYRLGGLEIEEHTSPELQPGGAVLVRRFSVTAASDAETSGLNFIAAAGTDIAAGDDGGWTVDKKTEISIKSDAALNPAVRESGGGRELIVPLELAPGEKLEFQVRIQW